MKKMITSIIASMLFLSLTAPPFQSGWIAREEPIRPYEVIWQTICQIESNGDSLAFCIDVNGLPSVGIAQIQQSRLQDYNDQSGDSLTIEDMFHPAKAKKVFMWYAEGDYEAISRRWNGGPLGMQRTATLIYWSKIIAEL
jgi:hypothetical protein